MARHATRDGVIWRGRCSTCRRRGSSPRRRSRIRLGRSTNRDRASRRGARATVRRWREGADARNLARLAARLARADAASIPHRGER